MRELLPLWRSYYTDKMAYSFSAPFSPLDRSVTSDRLKAIMADNNVRSGGKFRLIKIPFATSVVVPTIPILCRIVVALVRLLLWVGCDVRFTVRCSLNLSDGRVPVLRHGD